MCFPVIGEEGNASHVLIEAVNGSHLGNGTSWIFRTTLTAKGKTTDLHWSMQRKLLDDGMVKSELPRDMHPWLEFTDGKFEPNTSWLEQQHHVVSGRRSDLLYPPASNDSCDVSAAARYLIRANRVSQITSKNICHRCNKNDISGDDPNTYSGHSKVYY